MKKLFLFFLVSTKVMGSSISIDNFDQLKLAELVSELPLEVRSRTLTDMTTPRSGLKVLSVFPREMGAFQFICTSFYYGPTYASSGKCDILIDLHHPDLDKNYDEIKITLTNTHLVAALFATIPYGNPEKKIYSTGYDAGTTFEGEYSNVFHYRISCAEKKCELRFSYLKLKD